MRHRTEKPQLRKPGRFCHRQLFLECDLGEFITVFGLQYRFRVKVHRPLDRQCVLALLREPLRRDWSTESDQHVSPFLVLCYHDRHSHWDERKPTS